jgi:hypothetical protein
LIYPSYASLVQIEVPVFCRLENPSVVLQTESIALGTQQHCELWFAKAFLVLPKLPNVLQ